MPAPYFMDMMSNNPFGSLNLQWNEGIERMNTWAGFMQCNNFGNLSLWQYPNMMMGNSYLTNPNYSIAQTNWQWNQQGFGCNTPWANGGNMWGTFGWNPSGKTSGAGDSKTETEEDKKYQKKYEKIKEFLENIKDEKEAKKAQASIEFALEKDNSEKSWKERFEALKTAYDKIGADNVKKFLKNKELNEELLTAGFEYKGTSADDIASSINVSIANLSDDQGYAMQLGNITKESVLDIISSWNTNQTDKKHIINTIAEKYDKLTKATVKETVQRDLNSLKDSLIGAAQDLADTATEESKEKIEAAIQAVNEEFNKILKDNKKISATNLAEAFDDLYVLTRLAAISKVAVDAKEKYGVFDSELFDEELFLEETKKDLENEQCNVNNVEIKIETEEVEEDDNKVADPDKQIETLKKNDYVAKTEKTTINGNETDVYVTETGRKLIVNDGKVMEIKDGEFVDVDLDEVKREIRNKRTEAREAENKRTKEINNSMIYNGKITHHLLWGYTVKDNAERVNGILENINKDNVKDFLSGVYANDDSPREGLIERLDDDNPGKKITMKNKLKLIDAILEAYKTQETSKDIEVKQAYQTLKMIREKYNEANDEFNKQYELSSYWSHGHGKAWSAATGAVTGLAAGAAIGAFGGPIGAGIGAVIGVIAGYFIGLTDKITDNEIMDECIQILYKEEEDKKTKSNS